MKDVTGKFEISNGKSGHQYLVVDLEDNDGIAALHTYAAAIEQKNPEESRRLLLLAHGVVEKKMALRGPAEPAVNNDDNIQGGTVGSNQDPA